MKSVEVRLKKSVERLQQYLTETTWHDIYNLNKDIIKNPNLIYPNQQLKMPDGSTYTVKPGDNLTKIAAMPTTSPQTTTPATSTTPPSPDASGQKVDEPTTVKDTPKDTKQDKDKTSTNSTNDPSSADYKNNMDIQSDNATAKNQYDGNYDLDVAKFNWLVAKAKGYAQNPNELMQTSKGIMAPNGFVAQSVAARHAADSKLSQNTADEMQRSEKFANRRQAKIEADLAAKKGLWTDDKQKVRDWLEDHDDKSVDDAIKELNLKLHESIRSIIDTLISIDEGTDTKIDPEKALPHLTPQDQFTLEMLVKKLTPFIGKDDHLDKIFAEYNKLPDIRKSTPTAPAGQQPPVPGAKWTGSYWQLPEQTELAEMLKIAGLK